MIFKSVAKISVQLYSFIAKLIHFKVMQRYLITVNLHQGC